MKTTFVVPKNDDRNNPLSATNSARILPPAGLARMAGFAGRLGRVALVDERIVPVDSPMGAIDKTDIAVLFINNYNRERCFELARLCRQAGSYVVLTGPALSRDSAQALDYADSLLLGFGAECLADFLLDFQQGEEKRFYGTRAEAISRRWNTAGSSAALSLVWAPL